MKNSTTKPSRAKATIDDIGITSDTLTDRGGLSLFVRYLRGIGIYDQLLGFFGSMRKSKKGQPIPEVFKQIFCFFVDGTSRFRGHVSSHRVKRFFKAFWRPRIYLFREAIVRHGVRPTYKRMKGFAPLQMSWGRFIIDAVFRRGDTHSHHSDTAQEMIRHVVTRIRKRYEADVPIIIRMDSGFFDQKIFEVCEEIKVGYICGGRLYRDITDYVDRLDASL